MISLQWADFREDFEKGLDRLLKRLGSLQSRNPVLVADQKSKGYAFISYAVEDGAFVEDLKKYLQERGYSYWDFMENPRNYQIDYSLELERVITNAEATLSVISPNWKKSPTTLQELHFTKELQKPIFLLRILDPGPTLALAGMTFIDFTDKTKAGFARLDTEMKKFGL